MSPLELVKMRLGITSNVRDTYLQAIIDGIQKELLKHQGITLDLTESDEVLFLVDYACYRYANVGDTGAMPKHLYWRMRNLYLKKNGDSNVVQ